MAVGLGGARDAGAVVGSSVGDAAKLGGLAVGGSEGEVAKERSNIVDRGRDSGASEQGGGGVVVSEDGGMGV